MWNFLVTDKQKNQSLFQMKTFFSLNPDKVDKQTKPFPFFFPFLFYFILYCVGKTRGFFFSKLRILLKNGVSFPIFFPRQLYIFFFLQEDCLPFPKVVFQTEYLFDFFP